MKILKIKIIKGRLNDWERNSILILELYLNYLSYKFKKFNLLSHWFFSQNWYKGMDEISSTDDKLN